MVKSRVYKDTNDDDLLDPWVAKVYGQRACFPTQREAFEWAYKTTREDFNSFWRSGRIYW
jgi:hypothetical protein